MSLPLTVNASMLQSTIEKWALNTPHHKDAIDFVVGVCAKYKEQNNDKFNLKLATVMKFVTSDAGFPAVQDHFSMFWV